MFCRRCGNEIDDEARFCPRCGARAQAPEAAPEAAEAPASGATFAEAMDAARARSRRSVRVVALAALAAMLLSGAAWAAWTFYAEVVAPWIESRDAAVEQPADEAAEEPAEKAAPAAAGEPEHVLQVAEILAMTDGADMLPFIKSQGFGENWISKPTGPDSNPVTLWMGPAENLEPFASLSEAGIPAQPQVHFYDAINSRQPGVEIYLGVDATPPHGMNHSDIDEYTSTPHSLQAGESPSSIHIANLPLPLLSRDEAARLLEEAGLGSALVAETANPAEDAANAPMNAATELYAGFITIKEERYFWYFIQRPIEQDPGVESYIDSFIGCCNEKAVLQAVVDSQLYDANDWDGAPDEEKALMGAQAIAQGYYIACDGYRNNIVTGEYECLCPESRGSETYIWANRDEFAALYGEELAAQRFDNYIIGYEK